MPNKDAFYSLFKHFVIHYRLADFLSDAFPENSEYLLETFLHAVQIDLPECRMKDLHVISNILMKLNFKKTLNEPFCEDLLNNVELHYTKLRAENLDSHPKSVKLKISDSSHFIFLNVYLANMGLFETKYIESIFRAVNTSDELQRSETFKETLLSCTKAIIGIRPEGSDVDYKLFSGAYDQEIYEEVRKNTAIIQGTLAKIFGLDCLIDIYRPTYTGIRLNPNLRKKLSKLVVRQSIRGVNYKAMSNIFSDVCSVFNVRTAKQNYVFYGYLSPDSTTQDIVFCVDTESSEEECFKGPGLYGDIEISKRPHIQLIPLSKRFTNTLDQCYRVARPEDYLDHVSDTSMDHLNKSISNRYKWFAVCAPQIIYNKERLLNGDYVEKFSPDLDKNMKMFHTNYFGPFSHKVQKLQALGYNVIPISYDILCKTKDFKSINDVRKLINKQCGLQFS